MILSLWFLVAAWSCPPVSIPRDEPAKVPDFLPRGGLCALGEVARVEKVGVNRWLVRLGKVRPLFQDRPEAVDRVEPGQDLSVVLMTGLGGALVEPGDDWKGRMAIVLTKPFAGEELVSSSALPLAPSGQAFFVFDPGPDPRPEAIVGFADILRLDDPAEQIPRLQQVVEDGRRPIFLRTYAARLVGHLGQDDPVRRAAVAERLARWRDDPKSPPELRMMADDVLVDTSPPAYQWSAARLKFLSAVRDATDSPKIMAERARQRIEEAMKRQSQLDR
jgi:hypothetical protein